MTHKILIFGVPTPETMEGTKNIIPILSSKIAPITALGTVMCDITSDFLAELGVLSITREMGTFKSPALKEFELPAQSTVRASVSFRPLHSHTSSAGSISEKSISKTGSISLTLNSSDKSKFRHKGRTLKYIAHLYLLAGRWQDALREFSEAATILKSVNDHLWHASSLEGIGVCLVLLSFLESPASIPVIASNSESGNKPLFEFLPELTLKAMGYFAKSQSITEESVPQIVYCECILRLANLLSITRVAGGWNPASLNAIVRGRAFQHQNITKNSPSIAAISSWCTKVYATELKNIPVMAQANIYCGLSAIYSKIGMIRKRTFMLRELLLNIAPKIVKTKMNIAASNGVHASVLSVNDVGDSSITGLLDMLCAVYGGGDVTSIGYGWNRLRVAFIKTCFSVCEALLNYEGVVHFASILLSTSADNISPEEQIRLQKYIIRSEKAAQNAGKGQILADYWDSNILRDIKIVPTNTSIIPQNSTAIVPGVTGDNLFLHNPFSTKRPADTTTIMVQNERVEFTVKIQNPFAFEIHISRLSLETEDVKLNAVVRNQYILPNTVIEIPVPGVPLGIGKMKIVGAEIEIANCKPQVFHLIKSINYLLEDKIKEHGVLAGTHKGQEQRVNSSIKRSVEINVIEAQPVMVLKNIDQKGNWIMLLEGERQVFKFTVANISDVDAKMVDLKFSDSTTQPLQVALSKKDLQSNEIYEIEYFLFNRKALKWINKDEEGVNAHSTKTLEVEVLGKRGMNDGLIRVDYFTSRSQLWSRSLSLPLNITVNASIEVAGCDLIAIHETQSFIESTAAHLDSLKQERILSDHCLLVIDLRNCWTQTLEVTLWSVSSNGKELTTKTTINSGRTSRLLLPVKRINLTEAELNEPIPSFSNRQFLVDQAATKPIREAFWYRDKLLSNIGGTWRVLENERFGDVELRGLRLTNRMLHILSYDKVKIDISSTQHTLEDEFIELKITISNGTSKSLDGILRMIPSRRYGEDINDKIIWNGALQTSVIGLAPGESKVYKVGGIVVVPDEYVFGAIFETPWQDRYIAREQVIVKA